MPSITLLEQVLRRPDGRRHALAITRILRQRRARLVQHCGLPLLQKEWQTCQQLIAACDATLESIAILYRRYLNQPMESEDSNDLQK